jgi:D-alanyl-D-alanine carboxypeptidase
MCVPLAAARTARYRAMAIALMLGMLRIAGVAEAAPVAGSSDLRAAVQRDLDAYVRARSKAEHLSALSVTISLGRDAAALNVTSGTTGYHAGSRITPKNLFQIGSITKAFTAVAVLQLEAQGRLSIDAPIGAYLPQYPAYANLTLRHLLDMTSGLESYDNLPVWYKDYVRAPRAYRTADSLIRLVYPAKKYPQGTRYSYSNTGYLLAQEVVAARSASHSFEREMARIIASAGLKDTFYSAHLYDPAVMRRLVAGYYENDDPLFEGYLGRDMSRDSLSWAQGAGAIVSTPSDIARWTRALFEFTALLPDRQRREQMRLVSTKTARPLASPNRSDPAGFGLGVARRYDAHLGSFWFYQGETLGFRATHLYFPQRDLVVTIFANSRPVEPNSKIQELFATLDKHIRAAQASSQPTGSQTP